MDFVESRLFGVAIDEAGHEVVLSIVDRSGIKCALKLHGVERILLTDFRQQNVIEGLTHWASGASISAPREAVFFLMAGVAEEACDSRMKKIAQEVVDRVARGELEFLEITAVFGAQILASFSSMTVQREI